MALLQETKQSILVLPTQKSSSVCCHARCLAVSQGLCQFGCKFGVKNKMQQDMIESILCWYVVKSCSMHTELGQPPFYRHKASRSPYLFPGYDSGFVQGTCDCCSACGPWYLGCVRCYASTDPANVIPCANPYISNSR